MQAGQSRLQRQADGTEVQPSAGLSFLPAAKPGEFMSSYREIGGHLHQNAASCQPQCQRVYRRPLCSRNVFMALSYIWGRPVLPPRSIPGFSPRVEGLSPAGNYGVEIAVLTSLLLFSRSFGLLIRNKTPYLRVGCKILKFCLGASEEEGTGVRGSSGLSWSLGAFWLRLGVSPWPPAQGRSPSRGACQAAVEGVSPPWT